MGYAQWILLNIINSLQNQNIQINDAYLSYGRFHTVGNMDHEISSATISNMQILAGHRGSVASSGRKNSPTGTTGSIDLYHAGTKICTLYWDCPWSGHNTFEVRDENSDSGYWCEPGHWNRDREAIGNVEVRVSNENRDLKADLNVEVGK